MARYLTIALITFALSAALTWMVRYVGHRCGWLLQPRPDRSHTQPVALFGGAAIFVSLAAGLVAFSSTVGPLTDLLALTAGMFFLGLADDLWDLRPQTKLVAQITCGVLLYLFDFHFNADLPWLLDLAIVVFWVVAITNAMNLLDNMNGLCAGTAAIATVFRWMLYVQDGNPAGATQSAIFLGAVFGFLLFNFPRASIFMGDAGSLVVGFFLAALNLTSGESYSKSLFSVLFFPVLVLAIPILDTAFVSLVRSFSGRAVSKGGRDHMSHRLVAVGLSETAAVLILYGISIASGTMAFVLYRTGFSYAWFLGALVVLALTLFGVFLASVKVYPEDDIPWDVAARARGGFSLIADFKYKRAVLWVLVDTLTILVAWYTAVLVRYGETPAWPQELVRFTDSAPVALVAVLLGLHARGLYRTDWLRFSLHEVRAIVTGAALGLGVTLLVLGLAGNEVGRRPGLVAIAFGANVLMLAGTRFFVRTLADTLWRGPKGSERILVYGAGKGGELALRELRSNNALAKVPVGFIDDDPVRKGMTLHGVPVLGGLDALESLLRQHQIEAILVSTSKLSSHREAELSSLAQAHDVRLYRLHLAIVPFDTESIGTPRNQSSEVLRATAHPPVSAPGRDGSVSDEPGDSRAFADRPLLNRLVVMVKGVLVHRAVSPCLVLLPAIATAALVNRYGVDVPFWDEWAIAGFLDRLNAHALTLGALLSQHNEHRPLVPRLIQISAASLWGWNARANMWLTQALLMLMLLGCVQLWRRSVRRRAARSVLLLALVSLLLYSPAQSQNLLWGFQISFYLPAACLLGNALIATPSLATLGVALLVTACLATIATFSILSGALCWPLTAVLLVGQYGRPQGRDLWKWAAWIIAGGLVLALYFLDYVRPSNSPPLALGINHPLDFLAALCAFVGNGLSFGADPLTVARTVGAATIAVFVFLISYVWRHRKEDGLVSRTLPWTVMGLYGLSAGVAATLGRVGYGDHAILQSRYAAMACWVFVAVVMITVTLHDSMEALSKGTRRIAMFSDGLAFSVVALYAANFPHSLELARTLHKERLQAKAVYLFEDVAPSGSPMVPDEFDWNDIRKYVRRMRETGWLPPRPSFAWGPADEPCAFGVVDAFLMREQRLMAGGWAFLPDTNRSADAVLVTSGSQPPEPVLLAIPRSGRGDVAEFLNTPDAMGSGWFVDGLVLDHEVDLNFWALDVPNLRAYPLCRERGRGKEEPEDWRTQTRSANAAPLGTIDVPAAANVTAGSSVTLVGWAADDRGIREIRVKIGGELAVLAGLTLDRPDVSEAFPTLRHGTNRHGWRAMLEFDAPGSYAVTVEAVDTDGAGTELGSRMITHAHQ